MTHSEQRCVTEWEEVRESLLVTTEEEQQFRGFDGEPTEAMVKKAEIRIPADPDLAKELGHALLDYYASKQPAGPPGQKPMHQQYAEVEPEP